MMIEMTVAKIGRSMKYREIMGGTSRFLPTRRWARRPTALGGIAAGQRGGHRGELLGLDYQTRTQLRQPADHHPLVQLEARRRFLVGARLEGADDAQTIFLERTGLHATILNLLLGIHDVNEFQSLVGADGAVDYQYGAVRGAKIEPDTDEHAREQFPHSAFGSFVVEDCPHRNRAGGGVDLVVDEVEFAAMRKSGFALDRHPDGDSRQLAARFGQQPLVGPLLNIEVGVHLLHRDDGGEQRLVFAHDVAGGVVIPADASADGSVDLGEREVEFGAFESRFGTLDASVGRFDVRLVLVDLEEAAGPSLVSLFVLSVDLFGKDFLGLIQRELPLSLIDNRLIRFRVDSEEHVARDDLAPIVLGRSTNFGSFGEGLRLQFTGDAGTNADRLHRVGPAGVFGEVGDFAFGRVAHGNDRRGRCGRRGLTLTAREYTREYAKSKKAKRICPGQPVTGAWGDHGVTRVLYCAPVSLAEARRGDG